MAFKNKMSNLIKCVYARRRLSSAALVEKATTITNALSQPQYSQVVPTAGEVQAVLDQFKMAQEQCSVRNYQMKPVRDALREQLELMLKAQCASLNGLGYGDPEMLAASGFDLAKTPGSRPLPEQGLIVSITAQNTPGSALVRFKGIKGREFYRVVVCKGDHVCGNYTVTDNKCVIRGYAEGDVLSVRVCGVNSAGEGLLSEAVLYLVPGQLPESHHGSTGDKSGLKKVA